MIGPLKRAIEIIVRVPQSILSFGNLNTEQLGSFLPLPDIPMSNIGRIVDKGAVPTFLPLLVLFCHSGQVSIGVYFSGKDKIASCRVVTEVTRRFARYRTDEIRGRVGFAVFGGKCNLIRVDVGARVAFYDLCKSILCKPEELSAFLQLPLR